MNPCLLISFYFRGEEKKSLLGKASNYVLDPIYKQIKLPGFVGYSVASLSPLTISFSAHIKMLPQFLNLPFIAYLLNNYKHKVLNKVITGL